MDRAARVCSNQGPVERQVQVEHKEGLLEVCARQAATCHPGECVRHGTPEGSEYLAVCVPAYSLQTVHRDQDH